MIRRFFFPLVVGLILSVPFFSVGYWASVETSSPEFCASCHEIEPAVQDWRTSSHASNDKGLVANCMDCHLPPAEQPVTFFAMKAYHGMKDVYGHYFGPPYDREQNRIHAGASIQNETCLRCHANILYIPQKRGAMKAHRDVLYAKPGQEKKCLSCHEHLVHKPQPLFAAGN